MQLSLLSPPRLRRLQAGAGCQPRRERQPHGSATVAAGDPYGFLGWLNATRASYGLPAVGYDANLTNWAAMNNDQQAARGMGHFVMGPARRQNAAMGAFANIGTMWMNSPAHRAALLDPTITAIGIAGLGPTGRSTRIERLTEIARHGCRPGWPARGWGPGPC